MMMMHRFAFPQHSSSESSDFDSIFAGVSLQSLLLGNPVLLTPPPPPFPSSSSPVPMQQYHYQDDGPRQPSTIFLKAEAVGSSRRKQATARQAQRRPPPPRVDATARWQRPKLTDRFKELRRMIPCDEKVDIATMLGEAYKYVSFLEAQVMALLAMPSLSLLDGHDFEQAQAQAQGQGQGQGHAFLWSGSSGGYGTEWERMMSGALGKLSRQEMLRAVVNSPSAQRVMYQEGMCLVSEEQVRVLGYVAFQKQLESQPSYSYSISN